MPMPIMDYNYNYTAAGSHTGWGSHGCAAGRIKADARAAR